MWDEDIFSDTNEDVKSHSKVPPTEPASSNPINALEELFPAAESDHERNENPKVETILKQIGLNEKIYTFTDLYLPISQKVEQRYTNCINLHSSQKLLQEFQKTCILPQSDLSASIEVLRKRVKDASEINTDNTKYLLPKGRLCIESSRAPLKPSSVIESVEFFKNLLRDVEIEWQEKPAKSFDDYSTLIKNVDQARKEKVEEEQQRRLKEALKKRGLSKEMTFDFLIRNQTPQIATPTFNFGNDIAPQEAHISLIERIESQLERKTSIFPPQRDFKEDQIIINLFMQHLRKSQGPECVHLHIYNDFTDDLNHPCFFQYKLSGSAHSDLSLDIYKPKKTLREDKTLDESYNKQSKLFHQDVELLVSACKNFPLIDDNEKYFRAALKYFGEADKKEEPVELTAIIDQGKTGNGEKDALREQKAMKAKKMTRLANAQHNKLTGLPEENRKEILQNTQSDFRKAFDLDKIQDFNKNEEIVVLKKRKAKPLYHSRVAEEFFLHDFLFPTEKMLNLYHTDFAAHMLRDILFTSRNFIVFIVNRGFASRLKSKLHLEKVVEAHRIFDSVTKLSLRSDNFVLIEYVEKDPLILSDIGMGLRLERLIYPTRLANQIINKNFESELHSGEDFLTKNRDKLSSLFASSVDKEFGPLGEDVFLVESERIPFIGQLTLTNYCGISLLDSNLSATPVFYQNFHKTDFLLVVSEDRGEKKYFLRKIETVYVAGQIEPKQEIFSPYSRQYTFFQGKLLRFYIKLKFESDNRVDLENLKDVFPETNEQTLRRQIKGMGGEEEYEEKNVFVQKKAIAFEQIEINDESELRITPEEVCIYQRMRQSMAKLSRLGIVEIKSTDKIGVLKSKFYKKFGDDIEMSLIAKRILEEVQLSAWNVSQSFLICKHGQARMYLFGFGDPTNGHGGINFIKLPLKMSRYESSLSRSSQRLKPQVTVTGTNADLRSLRMKFVHPELRKHGVSEDILNALERWDKIDLLKKIANKKADDRTGGSEVDDIIKFARNQRMTTEKQKEKYQADINQLFMKMIDNLSKRNFNHIKYQKEVILFDNWENLIQEQKEELTKTKKLNDQANGHHIVRTRNPKQKTIVLRHCIKK